jgi:MFS family permease
MTFTHTTSADSTAAAVRRLAISQGLSLAGRGAAMTALIWVVYTSTGSSWWVSGAMLGIFGISTVVSPWTGHAGDRLDRRRIVVLSSLIAAVAYAVSAVLVGVGLIDLLIALMIAAASTQSALGAAVQGAVPNLVESEDLSWANSVVGAFKSAGFMLGPGIGGALLAVIRPDGVFVVSALILVVAAVIAAQVKRPLQSVRDGDPVGSSMDGYRVLWNDAWMRRLTLSWSLVMVGIGPVIVAEVILARHFGVGSVGYGLIAVFWDGGGVVGAILGRTISRRFEEPAVFGGSLAIAMGFAVVGLTPVFWPVLLGMALAGSFDSFGVVAAQNIIQRRTPDAVRSRVSAALDALMLGAMSASFALGAPLVELLGAQGVYLFAAGLTVVGTLLLIPMLRREPEAIASGAFQGERRLGLDRRPQDGAAERRPDVRAEATRRRGARRR